MAKKKKKVKDQLLEEWKIKGAKKWGKECEICGDNTYIQGHHFYPYKTYKLLRHEPLNYVPLCRGCHYSLEKYKRFEIIFDIIIKRGIKWLKKLKELNKDEVGSKIQKDKTKSNQG
jgi:hypothetical protein